MLVDLRTDGNIDTFGVVLKLGRSDIGLMTSNIGIFLLSTEL